MTNRQICSNVRVQFSVVDPDEEIYLSLDLDPSLFTQLIINLFYLKIHCGVKNFNFIIS